VTLKIVAPPDTQITAGPNNITSGDTKFTFKFTSIGGVAPVLKFECKLDGANFAPCTSPVSYRNLANGLHSFQVRAIDAVGQVDASPASASWTVKVVCRATQQGQQIWIERDVSTAGIGDYDGKPKDGWSLVARTNGDDDNGDLRGFYVENGIPYAIILNHSSRYGNRCIAVTPQNLSTVQIGQTRLMNTFRVLPSCQVP